MKQGIGYDSPDELVGRARIPGDERWQMRGIIQEVIADYDRYIVAAGLKSASFQLGGGRLTKAPDGHHTLRLSKPFEEV